MDQQQQMETINIRDASWGDITRIVELFKKLADERIAKLPADMPEDVREHLTTVIDIVSMIQFYCEFGRVLRCVVGKVTESVQDAVVDPKLIN